MVFGICSSVLSPGSVAEKPQLAPVYQWNQLEFDYPSSAARQAAILEKTYEPGHPAPIDVDVHYAGKTQIRITPKLIKTF